MILDTLDRFDLYFLMHPLFAKAVQFLRRTDLAQLADGRHEIQGDDLFALVATSQGRGCEASPLEAHRKYIDIQYVISGDEVMGYSPLHACKTMRDAYASDRDIEFFSDAPQSWFAVPPGMLAVFYPQDAHVPLAGQGTLKKVVVKVRV